MSMIKRPLRWRLDDKFGTQPLFDLLLGGPSGYSVSAWMQGIGVHLVALLRPSGRAYLRWHWMYRHNIGGRARRDREYRRFIALQRLERRRRKEWWRPRQRENGSAQIDGRRTMAPGICIWDAVP